MKKIIIFLTALLVVCFSVVPCFADEIDTDMEVMPVTDYISSNIEGLPDIPYEFSINSHIILQRDNGSIHLITFEIKDGNTYILDGDSLTITGKVIAYYWYLLEDIDGVKQWSVQNSGAIASFSPFTVTNVSKILASKVNITDPAGNVVFPPAPSLTQAMAEKVPSLVIRPMMETAGLLTLLGVGLMASLILLEVLKIVLRRFLPL